MKRWSEEEIKNVLSSHSRLMGPLEKMYNGIIRQLQADLADCKEVIEDHKRLVRELDVIWNGPAGAAKQASFCDLVAQIRKQLNLP